MAETRSRHEVLVPSDTDHFEVAKIIQGTKPYNEVGALLHSASRRRLEQDISLSTLSTEICSTAKG